MIATKLRFGVLLLLLLGAQSLAQDALIDYRESLQQFELRQDDVDAMRFDAFGRRFDVRLLPNQNVLTTMVRQNLPAGVGVFRGTIENMPGSWARIVVADGVPRGLLWDGTTMYAIEADKHGDEAGKAHIFRLEDLRIPAGAMMCGEPSGKQSGTELLNAVAKDVAPVAARAPGAVSAIDVAVLADFEFASAKGSDVETEIATRMNNVDGIFSEQLGVQINMARTDVFASADDPFTDESNAGRLLDELTDYRAANAEQRANGLSHLFTGRDLDGGTVGVAYTNAICSRNFGAGLTQGTHSATVDSLIAAHEIGHNFGAPHDGTTGSACEDTSEDFLMAPRLNGSDTFSACSIAQMQDDVDRASCITALPSLDLAVVADPAGPSLLGDSTTVSFVVNSVGTEDAADITVDITVPASDTLDGISSTLGSCSSGGGSANCTIGSISAGSSATISVDITSTSPGSSSFSATVTAAGDSNSGNNAATLNITVDPAVDLIATAAATSVTIDSTATARVTIENRATIAASSAAVTITAGTGIRLDSASWPAGGCSIAGSVATCTADSLAAQSVNRIDVGITGLTVGNRSLTIDAAATETDRDTGNNSVQASVTVNEQQSSGGGDSEGGGVLGLLQILGLLAFALTRSLRRLR